MDMRNPDRRGPVSFVEPRLENIVSDPEELDEESQPSLKLDVSPNS